MSLLESFEELYRLYYSDVYHFILSICKDKDLAEEITQEAFYKAMINADKFEGKSAVKTWIIKIARNELYNHYKKQKWLQFVGEDDVREEERSSSIAVDPSEDIAKRETIKEIIDAHQKLEDPYKQVFSLRCFGNLSFAEIAKLYKRTESWARVTFYRAKQKIREEML